MKVTIETGNEKESTIILDSLTKQWDTIISNTKMQPEIVESMDVAFLSELQRDVEYLSESKGKFIPVQDMNPVHCVYAVRKLMNAYAPAELLEDEVFIGLLARIIDSHLDL